MDGQRDDLAVLVCRVQSRLCGWPLAGVDEILRPQPLRPLASPVPHVPGLARIRGRWIPVVDLASALNLAPADNGSHHNDIGGDDSNLRTGRWVVVHQGDRPAALAVSEVLGLQRLSAQALEALPPLLQDTHHAAVTGMAARHEALIALLDVARLMPDLPDSPEPPIPPSAPDPQDRADEESAA